MLTNSGPVFNAELENHSNFSPICTNFSESSDIGFFQYRPKRVPRNLIAQNSMGKRARNTSWILNESDDQASDLNG